MSYEKVIKELSQDIDDIDADIYDIFVNNKLIEKGEKLRITIELTEALMNRNFEDWKYLASLQEELHRTNMLYLRASLDNINDGMRRIGL